MAVGHALTVIEIVAITISVLFVFTQFLIQSVSRGRIPAPASELFNILLVVHLGLVVSVAFASAHAAQDAGPYLTAAIVSLALVLQGLSYGSAVAAIAIREEITETPDAKLDQFHRDEYEDE